MQQITVEDHFKVNGIIHFTFSPDGQYIAVSLKNDMSIEIYQIVDLNNVNTWKLQQKLKDAQQTISSVDWSPQNVILQTSYDRSVMVWRTKNQRWTRDLVIIENSRAALCGKWNHTGQKFAIGTGDHILYLGYYEEVNNWWQSKPLKKQFKSSIISVDFHPSGRLVGVGSSDQTFGIFTMAVVDEHEVFQPQYEDLTYTGPFQNVQTFGETILKLEIGVTGGWVHGVAFSPNCYNFVFSTHNGFVHYGYLDENGEGDRYDDVYITPQLPFTQITFVNDQDFVCGGFEGNLSLLRLNLNNKKIEFLQNLSDSSTKVAEEKKSVVGGMTSFWDKKNLQPGSSQSKVNAATKGHRSPINCLRVFPSQSQSLVSSSDVTGQIFSWKI